MAKLILSPEENDSATYLEWSDEALGKAVKKLALDLSIGDEALTIQGTLLLLVGVLNKYNADSAVFKLENVTNADTTMGNWKYTIEKISEESDGTSLKED